MTAGVILSAIFFVAKISTVKVVKRIDYEGIIFDVEGQLFFASADEFAAAFDFDASKKTIVIDFTNAHVWDDSAVGAIDRMKFKENHNHVSIKNLNAASRKLVEKLAVLNDPKSKLPAH